MTDRTIAVAPRHDADCSLDVRRGSRTVARASLWWSNVPTLEGRRVGYLGDYASDDAHAAQSLLARVEGQLRKAGCSLAVGPVDGSTWMRYRFVTQRGERPPFLLEPQNPDAYPDQLRAAGFAPLAHYVSAEEALRDEPDPRAARSAGRLRASGVTIRPFDRACWNAELDAMFDVAHQAFATSLLFSPIDRARFRALYAPLRERIDPDFIRIAEHAGRAVGFAFGIVDQRAIGSSRPYDTLVGKTQARIPGRRYAGLGTVMLDDIRQRAHQRGLRRLIHALIREDTAALNASQRVARVFRRYALFARSLR